MKSGDGFRGFDSIEPHQIAVTPTGAGEPDVADPEIAEAIDGKRRTYRIAWCAMEIPGFEPVVMGELRLIQMEGPLLTQRTKSGNTAYKCDMMGALKRPLYRSLYRRSALAVVCLSVFGLGGAGTEKSSAVIDASTDVAVVALSRDGVNSEVTSIHCARTLDAQRTCARLLDLKPRRTERCFQIWGGASWAVITMPNADRLTFTRANSCEIARWNRLQSLLQS